MPGFGPGEEFGEAVAAASGGEANALLTKGGLLFTQGGNLFCETGHPNSRDIDIRGREHGRDWQTDFKPLRALPEITSVSCGLQHMVAVGANGEVWAWGRCQQGALGLGVDFDPKYDPEDPRATYLLPHCVQRTLSRAGLQPSDPFARVTQAACGLAHSVFLDEKGCVWTCGANTYAATGQREFTPVLLPTRVAELAKEHVVKVAAGQHHSVALTATGDVWTWGLALHGQCGVSTGRTLVNPMLTPLDDTFYSTLAAHSKTAHILAAREKARGSAQAASATPTPTPAPATDAALAMTQLRSPGRLRSVTSESDPVVDIFAGFTSTVLLLRSGKTIFLGSVATLSSEKPPTLAQPRKVPIAMASDVGQTLTASQRPDGDAGSTLTESTGAPKTSIVSLTGTPRAVGTGVELVPELRGKVQSVCFGLDHAMLLVSATSLHAGP